MVVDQVWVQLRRGMGVRGWYWPGGRGLGGVVLDEGGTATRLDAGWMARGLCRGVHAEVIQPRKIIEI